MGGAREVEQGRFGLKSIAVLVLVAATTALGLREATNDTERISSDLEVRDEGASHWDGATAYKASAPGDVPTDLGGHQGVTIVSSSDVGEYATEEPLSEPVVPEPAPLTEVEAAGTISVHLTFYVCAGAPPGQSYCGTMASGNTVYEGAAACGYGLGLGVRFKISGDPTARTYVCEDRGAGPYWWIDVFWYDYANGRPWRNQFGQDVEIEVIQ